MTDLTARPLVLIVAFSALSLLPFALLMMTSFVRISVVLSILRSAIGTPSVPPTQVLTGLALVLTVAVMTPTAERVYAAVGPSFEAATSAKATGAQTVSALQAAADRGKEPLRDFMLRFVAAGDRASFLSLARKMRNDQTGEPSEGSRPLPRGTPPGEAQRSPREAERASVTDRDFAVIVPAFVTSELRRAFQIGFLLFVPFLVVDLVIANLLLALGMHMLSPTTVSLPFKLLLFVMADGWHLVVRGLLQGFV